MICCCCKIPKPVSMFELRPDRNTTGLWHREKVHDYKALMIPSRSAVLELKSSSKSERPCHPCSDEPLHSVFWNRCKVKVYSLAWEMVDVHPRILNLFIGNCCYCGEPALTNLHGIDRIQSDLGYISGNCVTCCWQCNRAKNDTPYNELFDGFIKSINIS